MKELRVKGLLPFWQVVVSCLFSETGYVGAHHRQRCAELLALQSVESGLSHQLQDLAIRPATVQDPAPYRLHDTLKMSKPTPSRCGNVLKKIIATARLEYPQDFLQNRFHLINRAKDQGSNHSVQTFIPQSKVLRQADPQTDRSSEPDCLFPNIGMEEWVGLDAGPANLLGEIGKIDPTAGSDLQNLSVEGPPSSLRFRSAIQRS